MSRFKQAANRAKGEFGDMGPDLFADAFPGKSKFVKGKKKRGGFKAAKKRALGKPNPFARENRFPDSPKGK